MKLWQKNYEINREIEKFTVGDDYLIDQNLVEADALGSIAHAKMLNKIGILSSAEFKKLKKSLLKIIKLNAKGQFKIKPEQEDVHTAVENYVAKKLGSTGEKIHTARSRNDQVLVDLRLYSKKELIEIELALLELCRTLLAFAEKNKKIPMVGRTNFQKAMPSSVGLWAGAFAESLLDDLELIEEAYELNDQCPLGSAASYGANLNIDRAFVSDLLGFAKVQNNVLYANNSRGKFESVILSALSQVMLDLGKFSTDLILFSTPEFGYFEIPLELCTGSSLMPQKKNPDVLESIRAKCSVLLSYGFQCKEIIKSLPSGYNRDFSLTKEPLIKGMEIALSSLKITNLVVKNLKVNKNNLLKGFT